MGVARDWGQGIARVGAVALLVPLALALGVALTAAIGGGTQLRALGQLVVGPERRTADTLHLERAGRLPSVPPLVTSRRVGRPAPPRRRLPSTRPLPSGGGPTSARPPRSPSGRPPAPRPPAGAPAPPNRPAPPPDATPPADPAPNPVRDAGTQAAQAAGALPAPAGPVAQDAVQAVVDLLSPPVRR